MRVRLVDLLILVLLALAPVAQAQDLVPRIGFYEDQAGTDCAVAISAGVPKTVYCIATLGTSPWQPDSLTGVQFYVQNWINTHNTPPQCFVTTTWFGLTIGAPDNLAEGGLSMTFTTPQAGPIVQLGTVRYTDFGYIAANHVMSVVTAPSGNPDHTLKIIDEHFVAWPANGQTVTLKCSGTCICDFSETPAEETSWGDIKALY